MKAVMSKELVKVLKSKTGRNELRNGLLRVAARKKTVGVTVNGQQFKVVLVGRKSA